MPPSAQNQAGGQPLSTTAAQGTALAPQHFDSASSTDPKSKLDSAKALTESDATQEFEQTGRASWYGRFFHGRRTANGERYNMNAMTAAHRTLPLGSYVRVTNPSTQRSVVVRINDRGPYVRNRVIDLSMAAASALDMQHSGTARVTIERISAEEAKQAQRDMLAANSDNNVK